MQPALSFTTVKHARQQLRDSEFCGCCNKLLLRDESAARSYLGLLLRTSRLRHGAFALQPYPCPRSRGWHVGRNRRTLQLNFKLGRVMVVSRSVTR
jgi:hypothetical protein